LRLAVDLAGAVVGRALEHHVLEEMRDAALTHQLIARADLVEEGRGDDRRLAVLQQADGEAVGQMLQPRVAGERRLLRPGCRLNGLIEIDDGHFPAYPPGC